MKLYKKYAPAVFLFLTIVIFFEAISQLGLVQTSILPPPSSVLRAMYTFREQLTIHAYYTMLEVSLGFFFGIIAALGASVFLFYSKRVRRAVYPLLVVAHIIPIIALAPILLLWLGFGIWPKVIVVALYSFFPITATVTDGLYSTPKHIVEYARSLHISWWERLRHFHFPSALPQLFSGLKIASIYTVAGAVVGEYVGSFKGLGIFLQTAASSRATALVFATIAVIIVLSLMMVGLVILLENKVVHWKQYE